MFAASLALFNAGSIVSWGGPISTFNTELSEASAPSAFAESLPCFPLSADFCPPQAAKDTATAMESPRKIFFFITPPLQ